jgi:hypothetical protein
VSQKFNQKLSDEEITKNPETPEEMQLFVNLPFFGE